MAAATPADRPVVVYDGSCRLCQGFVRFARAHDPEGSLRFVTADTDEGGRILAEAGVDRPAGCLHSVLLVQGGRTYDRSTAALRALGRLRAPWSWLSALRVVPRPVRDTVYDFVAARRYRWFGRMRDDGGDDGGDGDGDRTATGEGAVCRLSQR